jgi:methionyl aminopeptidase
LNSTVLKELDATLDGVNLDEVRCLILTGAGEKSFVAGADIGEMSTLTKAEGEAFGKKGKGERLVPFHCITVEPMVNQGVEDVVEFNIPNSSIKYYNTADGLLSAQFEHTVLVTDTGYEILTLP